MKDSSQINWAGFYAAFEKKFRGPREEIYRRQSAYLPILEQINIKGLNAPALDVGCGRCEWVELLEKNAIPVLGVDFNEEFVKDGRDKGFNVSFGNAIDYLKSQPDGAFSCITSFHLVEHLLFEDLKVLIEEAYRVICPGGLLILETPNPENVNVGACNFYFDPTHRAPLPPGLLQFVVSDAGFSDAQIAYVNADCLPDPLSYLQRETENALYINSAIHLLNRAFFNAPDYAVIAQKPGANKLLAECEAIKELMKPEIMDISKFRISELEEKVKLTEKYAQEATARADVLEAKAKEQEARANEWMTRANEWEAKALQAQAIIQARDAELNSVYASRSWKITLPMRKLMALFR